MQEFFIDYGLWLLIALLVVIVVVFLLSGSRKRGASDVPSERVTLAETPPPAPVIAPPPPAAVTPSIVPIAQPAPAPEPIMSDGPATLDPTVIAAHPIPVSPAIAAPAGQPDDLLQLKGVGPKLNILLIELGVTSFARIAEWTDADIAAIDAKLGNFKGRPVRDQWIDQAKYLAAGDLAGFEAKYGKL